MRFYDCYDDEYDYRYVKGKGVIKTYKGDFERRGAGIVWIVKPEYTVWRCFNPKDIVSFDKISRTFKYDFSRFEQAIRDEADIIFWMKISAAFCLKWYRVSMLMKLIPISVLLRMSTGKS